MKVSLSVSARFLLFWAFILFAGSFVAAAPRWPFSAAEEPQKAAAEPEPPRLSPHEGNPIPPSHFNAKTIPKELRAQFYHELGLPSREWMRPEEMVDDKGKL
ncbi:hypothetical protein M427DRAFT_237836 [Gonapodya prolifera JEL478]|uniref:Uncharacterized protein n=1 Tax=Gonapodya prolifera (strain JEL478) TaxID=1344416 RepID=A0A139AMR1_GONPJ|nr:hypothetical protein M427DRAFT_237836 [Gonapodya prolifera JEL478]|eukprot:KXS18039.1 hypothetical protein M427DRAFT_237836 [Gonapodya prolifera JEL478]